MSPKHDQMLRHELLRCPKGQTNEVVDQGLNQRNILSPEDYDACHAFKSMQFNKVEISRCRVECSDENDVTVPKDLPKNRGSGNTRAYLMTFVVALLLYAFVTFL